MTHEPTQLLPASDVPEGDFIQALNAAYADYFVPIHLNSHSFRDLVNQESVRLDASRAAVIGDEVVGTALLGVRGARGWAGGVGVIPAHRRRGVARALMASVIEAGRALGLESIQLEVITANKPAHALYDSLGFETIRELLVLTCANDGGTPPAGQIAPTIRIAAGKPARLLPALAELPAPVRPWQRETTAHEAKLPALRALAAYELGGDLAGVCIFRQDSFRQDVLDLAATSPDAGTALAAHLLRQSPGLTVTYLNVPEEDPLLPGLRVLGFQQVLSQFEMVLPLNAGAAEE